MTDAYALMFAVFVPLFVAAIASAAYTAAQEYRAYRLNARCQRHLTHSIRRLRGDYR